MTAKIKRKGYMFFFFDEYGTLLKEMVTFTHVFAACFISIPDYTGVFGSGLDPYSSINTLTDKPIIYVTLMGRLKRFNTVIITIGINESRFPQKAPFSGVIDGLLKMAGQKGITGKLQNHCLLYLVFSK